MRNSMDKIWTKGFQIKRCGVPIRVTPNEVREIYNLIMAANGQGSVEWYLEQLDEDFKDASPEELPEILEKIHAGDEIAEDENKCYEIWNDYLEDIMYDTGDIEYEIVEGAVINLLGE